MRDHVEKMNKNCIKKEYECSDRDSGIISITKVIT